MQNGMPFGWPRVHLPTVDSTMPLMAMLAKAGAIHGTVLTTDFQSAGIGRERRPWFAPPGSSLLMSVVLKTSRPLRDVPIVSLLIAGCVGDTLVEFGVGSATKWPNDVLVRDLKISGILVRSQPSRESGFQDLIVGIGLNLTPPASNGVAGATNLETEAGGFVARSAVLDSLLARIGSMGNLFERGETESSIDRIRQRLAMLGESVVIVAGHNEIRGTVAGLRDDGALILMTPAGHYTFVLTGEVQRGPRLSDSKD